MSLDMKPPTHTIQICQGRQVCGKGREGKGREDWNEMG